MSQYDIRTNTLDILGHLEGISKKVLLLSINVFELNTIHVSYASIFKQLQINVQQAEKQNYEIVNKKSLAKCEEEIENFNLILRYKDNYDDEELVTLFIESMAKRTHYLKEIGILSPRHPESFLVNVWTSVLSLLEKISIFYLVRQYIAPNYTKKNARFVDWWLCIHSVLAVVYVIIVGLEITPHVIKYIFLTYSCIRMFEILIYQLNVILVHPYNTKNYSLNSYRRMTIALFHNFFEIIFWFAGTFIMLQLLTDSSIPMAIYTSFTHMVTYSMDFDQSKWSVWLYLILQFQAIIGVFMTVLSLARFISLFPQPMSMDPLEKEATEDRHRHIMWKLNEMEKRINENRASISDLEKPSHTVNNKR